MKEPAKTTGGKYRKKTTKASKKHAQRKWLQRILLVFALFCGAMMIYDSMQKSSGEDAYDHAAQIAFREEAPTVSPEVPPETTQPAKPKKKVWVPAPVEEEDTYMESLKAIDLKALQEVNPDVIGWILIPDTKINYPILQGEDNDFYLRHTWEKVRNAMGSIFMEERNQPDFTEFNTIIYGHNMNNGSMFGGLSHYRASWFKTSHPYIYIVNESGVFRYEVFAFHQVKLDSFVYGLSFNQQKTRKNFINSALEASDEDLGVVPQIHDRMLTLSTCSTGGSDTRWVVQARLPMIQVEE